ncbi:CBR-CYN-10 protein [Aphelenchoides bicaudatus]|nr:CBR-CYN-10 protein [Aphelenchoides bicaudatus]
MLHSEPKDTKLELNGSSIGENNHAPPTTTKDKQRTISKWLGKRLHVDLIDGRTITGILACTDNGPNFILTQADETWNHQPGKIIPTRPQIGSVLINARHVRRIFEGGLLSANFLALCASDYYNNCIFHRNIKSFIVQTGDPSNSGKGGDSIWGVPFEDEIHSDLLHDVRGLVSMASNGPSTNRSQFFITYDKQPTLDGKHTIFGKVIDGFDELEELENTKGRCKISASC